MKRKVYLIASMVFLLSLFFAMSVSAGAESDGSDTLTIKVNKDDVSASEFGEVTGYYLEAEDMGDYTWQITFRDAAGNLHMDIGSEFGTIFQGRTFVTEVHLTDTCDKIPANAFSGCTALTTVTTGTNCQTIESGAFSGCTNLSKVGDIEIKAGILSIPSTWASIGEGAFSDIKKNSKNSFNVIRWAEGASKVEKRKDGTTISIGDADHYHLTVASDSHGATVLGDVDYAYTAENAVFVRAGTSLTSFSADTGYYVTANNIKLSDSNDKMPAEETTISAASAVKTRTDSVEFNNVTTNKYGDCYAAFYFDDGKSVTMSQSIGELFPDVSPETVLHFYINVTNIPMDVHVNNAKLVK